MNRVAALVKNKFIQIPISNKDLLKPGVVVKKIQIALGNPKVHKNGKEKDLFNMDVHTRCWKKYEVRPINNAQQPEITKAEYCVYDQPNTTYLYTENWVDFLVEELNKAGVFESLYQ